MKYTASDGSLWHVSNLPPPVPTRMLDWEWVSDDYGGPGDDAHGYEPTKEAAMTAVECWVEENAARRIDEGLAAMCRVERGEVTP